MHEPAALAQASIAILDWQSACPCLVHPQAAARRCRTFGARISRRCWQGALGSFNMCFRSCFCSRHRLPGRLLLTFGTRTSRRRWRRLPALNHLALDSADPFLTVSYRLLARRCRTSGARTSRRRWRRRARRWAPTAGRPSWSSRAAVRAASPERQSLAGTPMTKGRPWNGPEAVVESEGVRERGFT